MEQRVNEREDYEVVDRGFTSACWIWRRTTKGKYGQAWDPATKRMRVAHRVVYERLVGPVPDGLELDHLCREQHCVNPDHLEPVTHQENVRRGFAGAVARAKTHCMRGHLLAGENVRFRQNGTRQCRACQNERARVQRGLRSAASAA